MATPTSKSKGIDDLLASLIDMSAAGGAGMDSNPRCTAIKNDVCFLCHAPATTFKDALSKKEFTISGICQTCQDDIFG